MWTIFVIFLVCYMLGSVNPAIIFSKKVMGVDIRSLGSGNAGSTNVCREMGLAWAIFVFSLDLAKVLVAYYVSILLANIFSCNLLLAKQVFLCAVVVGHCYPAMYKLQGGKGVATAIMAGFLVSPVLASVCIACGVAVLVFSRRVSCGSLCGVCMFAVLSFFFAREYIAPAIFVAVLVLWKHRKNICRICKGEEKKIF